MLLHRRFLFSSCCQPFDLQGENCNGQLEKSTEAAAVDTGALRNIGRIFPGFPKRISYQPSLALHCRPLVQIYRTAKLVEQRI